jgi:hypothetical protein
VKTGKLRFAFSVIETKIMAKSKLKNTAISRCEFLKNFVASISRANIQVLIRIRSLTRFVNSIYAREKCKACVHWLLPLSVRISVLLIPCC